MNKTLDMFEKLATQARGMLRSEYVNIHVDDVLLLVEFARASARLAEQCVCDFFDTPDYLDCHQRNSVVWPKEKWCVVCKLEDKYIKAKVKMEIRGRNG